MVVQAITKRRSGKATRPVAMIALSGLAFFRQSPLLAKQTAYCCAGNLPLAATTILAAWCS
jgi:hypothetical protein